MMDKRWQKRIYLVYILLIIVGILGYGIQKVCCFSLFPDEFGYWASAAHLSGYDWRETASLGSYYSFGYGFLLFPILKLSPDGITAYRAAIILNAVLMCGALWLLQGIVRELFPKENEVERVFCAAIAVLYPSWIFYMQMTMTEALLMFLLIVMVRLLIRLLKKPGIFAAVGLAVMCAFLYSVHMRTVGVVSACIIVLYVWVATNPRAKGAALIFLGVLLVAGIWMVWFKGYITKEVFTYAAKESLANNDYGGIWSKLQNMMSLKGLIHLAAGIAGKIFYLGLASFGLFYWAMGWSFRGMAELLDSVLRKKETRVEALIGLFLFMTALIEAIISSVYMGRDNSIDGLIYGRYNDFLVPVFMVTGICVMKRSRRFLRRTALSGTALGIMSFLLFILVEKEKRTGLRGYMAVGISYLIPREGFTPLFFFFGTWIFGVVLMLFTAVLLWQSSRREYREWMAGGILILEVVLGIYSSHKYIYSSNETHFIDKAVADTIKREADGEENVFYLKEDGSRYIDAIQMMLGERTVKVMKEEDFFDQEQEVDFLITVKWTKHEDKLREIYEKRVETNTFILYCHIKDHGA